jgi:hypothetical protein
VIAVVSLALTLQDASAPKAAIHFRYVSVCTPDTPSGGLPAFRFELARDDGHWTNRISFDSEVLPGIRELRFSAPKVQLVQISKPDDAALWDTGDDTFNGVKANFWVFATVRGPEISNLSVDVTVGGKNVKTHCGAVTKILPESQHK